MRLPFGTEAFLGVFARYNEAVWPAQLGLVLLALLAVTVAARAAGKGAAHPRVVSGVLALLWLWMGGVYHLFFFRAINPAAITFGIAFLVQGVLLLWYGVIRTRLGFHLSPGVRGMAGGLLIAHELVGYPLLGLALGHEYPATPTFGLPCPTTIFTFGLLLWAERPVPWAVFVIPLTWAVVGTSAAVRLEKREDVGLAFAALAVLTLQLLERRGRPPGHPVPVRR